MTVALTGTGGLFTRLGKLAKIQLDLNTFESSDLVADINALAPQFASTLAGTIAPITSGLSSWLGGAEAVSPALATAAGQIVQGMVQADNPSKAGTVNSSIAEVIHQMQLANVSSPNSATVQKQTVGSSTAVYPASGSNNGDGVILLGLQRGDGLYQELTVAEVDPIICTSDAQTGGATHGQEQFTFVGAADAGNKNSYLWPTGSGGSMTLNAVDSTQNNSGGNLLTNSGFEAWTSGVPNNWVADVGTAGTDFKEATSGQYQGSGCFEFLGGTAVLTQISQQFNASSGTLAKLTPLTSLPVNFRMKADVVPATGVIKAELVGGATYGTMSVLNDAQGTANSFTVTLHTALTTSWQAFQAVFRLPAVMPAVVAIRFVVTTVIPAGSNIFLDGAAATTFTPLYPGGPGCAIFSGATPFINGDGWYATFTNDRGGVNSFCGSFQALFDRWFGTRALGLLLPSNASPAIADSLI